MATTYNDTLVISCAASIPYPSSHNIMNRAKHSTTIRFIMYLERDQAARTKKIFKNRDTTTKLRNHNRSNRVYMLTPALPSGVADKTSSTLHPFQGMTPHAKPASNNAPMVQKPCRIDSQRPLWPVGTNSMNRAKGTCTPPRPTPTRQRNTNNI